MQFINITLKGDIIKVKLIKHFSLSFLILLTLLALSNASFAAVKINEPEGSGFLVDGTEISLPVEFSDGDIYTVKSVTREDSVAMENTFSNNVLTLTSPDQIQPATYTAIFTANNNDVQTTFKLYTTDASSCVANNAANLSILLTPVGAVSSIDAELTKNNLVNASDYTNSNENFSAAYSSGAENEITDSGFSLNIKLSNVPEGHYAIIGFSKAAYLNAKTLKSSELYDKISDILKKQPKAEEGGVTYYLVDDNAFKEMGISVKSVEPDRDLTNSVGAGAYFYEDSIVLIYGAMLADSSTIKEGVYTLSPEGEMLLNDGSHDDYIKASWYLALSDETIGGSSSGCNIMSSLTVFLLLASAALMIKSK